MKITKQYSENECGICVINSLVEHFYGINRKTEILEKSNLDQNGLTLYDFESLGGEFGLQLESFETDFDFYLNNFESEFCITLIQNHYVIIRKNKKVIELYDSDFSEVQKISIDEFKKKFSKILITIKKSTEPIKVFSFSQKTLDLISPKIFLILLLVENLIFAISILSAKYFSFLIEWSLVSTDVKNAFYISIAFLLFGIISCLLTYVKNIFTNNLIKNHANHMFAYLIKKLRFKQDEFYKKVKRETLFSMETFVFGYLNFTILEIPHFISNVIFCLLSGIILFSFNFLFSLPIFLILFCSMVFTIFEIKNKKTFIHDGIKTHNQNFHNYSLLANNICPSKILQLGKTFLEINKLNQNAKNFNGIISFSFFTTELLFSIIASFICCFLISKQQSTITDFLFLSSVLTIFTHCSFSICNFFSKKNEFEIFKDFLEKIANINNIQSTGIIKLKKIRKISYKEKPLLDKSCVSSEVVDQFLFKTKDNFLKINNLALKNYDLDCLYGTYVFCDLNNNDFDLVKNIDEISKDFLEIISKLNINISNFETLDQDQKTVMNLLGVYKCKNKIIFIPTKLKILRMSKYFSEIKIILNYLSKSNYIYFW